jgi:hypothetical protein
LLKSTLVRAADPAPLAHVPVRSPVIIDFERDPFDLAAAQACAARGHRIERVVVRAGALGDPHLESYLRQSIQTLVVLDAAPPPAEILRRGKLFAQPHLTVQLGHSCDADLTALKLLASLGVRTALDVRAFRDGGELFLEALGDAILKPGRRAPVTPIEEILAGFESDDTELAAFDLSANARFVDARAGAPDGRFEVEPLMARRSPLLQAQHDCTTCEGFGFCGTLLLEPGKTSGCRAAFTELFLLHDIARARIQAQAQRERERRDRPEPQGGRAADGARQLRDGCCDDGARRC